MKWRNSTTIPYQDKEHIEDVKRCIKMSLIREIGEEIKENKKYEIEIKTTVKEEPEIGVYTIEETMEITEIPQVVVEFIPPQEIWTISETTNILHKAKECFKKWARWANVAKKGRGK